MYTLFWLGNLKGGGHSEELGVDGKILDINRRESMVERCGLDSSGLEKESVAGPFEHVNEPSGSIKGGEFLD